MFEKKTLPPDVTEEQAKEIWREGTRAYHRQYRRDHPEIVMQQRIRAAISLLTRNGYQVTSPEGSDR